MARCVHPKCGRDDLPLAAAFPPRAGIACAHVNPAGEPCPESPSTDVYDAEALHTIVTEDKLWDIGLIVFDVETHNVQPGLHAPLITPGGAALLPPDMKLDVAERVFAKTHDLQDSPPAEIRAAMVAHEPVAAREPKKPDRRGAPSPRRRDDKRKAAIKPKDIDEWEP